MTFYIIIYGYDDYLMQNCLDEVTTEDTEKLRIPPCRLVKSGEVMQPDTFQVIKMNYVQTPAMHEFTVQLAFVQPKVD